MSPNDRTEIAHLVARADSVAVRQLVVALHGLEDRPKLRVALPVDAHVIDVAVEQHGRRLAVIVGRTGESRTDADKARDAALERAGWGVYRVSPERARTRPQVAVGDVLVALREQGHPVPVRVPAKRREGLTPAPIEELKKLTAAMGGRSVT